MSGPADLLPLQLKEEFEYLLHYGVAPREPARVQELLGRFQQCLLALHKQIEKHAHKVNEFELQLEQQAFHDPFAQKRDDLRLKEVEMMAKEERLRTWERDLEESHKRVESEEHRRKMEEVLQEETGRLKGDQLASLEHDLKQRERQLEAEREELRFREMDLKRKMEGADIRLENNFKKALTLEKAKMLEDLEIQVAQRSRKIEQDLEMHWAHECQRRVDYEVQRVRDQLMHDYCLYSYGGGSKCGTGPNGLREKVIDPSVHEQSIELDRRENEIHNLKAELLEERNTHETIRTRFRDEVRGLREKLTTKIGITNALKLFDINIRNQIVKDIGYVPSANEVIAALKEMSKENAQLAVTSAGVQMDPTDDDIMKYITGLDEGQTRRLVKKMGVQFDPADLAGMYRRLSPGQQEKFLADVLDKNSFSSIVEYLRKLDTKDQYSVMDQSGVPYLRRTDSAVIAYINDLPLKRQADILREIEYFKVLAKKLQNNTGPTAIDGGPEIMDMNDTKPKTKEDLLRIFKEMERQVVHDAIMEWPKLEPTPEDLKKLICQRLRPELHDRFMCLMQFRKAGEETDEVVNALRLAAVQRRRQFRYTHFH